MLTKTTPTIGPCPQKSLHRNSADSTNLHTPWIGSYFGIGEPVNEKTFTEKKIVQIEMHVLHRDLSVKTYQLRHSPEEKGCAEEDIEGNLRGLAYLDARAVAHMIYVHEINPVTGERLKESTRTRFPSVRIGEHEWRWHDHLNHSEEIKAIIEQAYRPAACRVFSASY